MNRFFFKVVDFFIFSSIFIALCAGLMAWQTLYVFQLPIQNDFILFVVFGTLSSYSFHWYLTPAAFGSSYRIQWSIRNKWFHFVLFLISIGAAAYFVWQLKEHWLWLLAIAFITFLYSAPKIPFKLFLFLRKIAIAKTIFLALVWTLVTAFLPLQLYNEYWTNSQYTFVVNRFYLIYAICVLFDYRDREEDKKAGIKSIIIQLGEFGVAVLFWGSMITFLITGILMYVQNISLPHVIALTIPGFILILLYRRSKQNFSDYLYYFVLDGLMMLSAVLLPLLIYLLG